MSDQMIECPHHSKKTFFVRMRMGIDNKTMVGQCPGFKRQIHRQKETHQPKD